MNAVAPLIIQSRLAAKKSRFSFFETKDGFFQNKFHPNLSLVFQTLIQ